MHCTFSTKNPLLRWKKLYKLHRLLFVKEVISYFRFIKGKMYMESTTVLYKKYKKAQNLFHSTLPNL